MVHAALRLAIMPLKGRDAAFVFTARPAICTDFVGISFANDKNIGILILNQLRWLPCLLLHVANVVSERGQVLAQG